MLTLFPPWRQMRIIFFQSNPDLMMEAKPAKEKKVAGQNYFMTAYPFLRIPN